MKIKSLELENFKCVKLAKYDFSNRTNVNGKNGKGKSTIVAAYMWLMCDSDENLHKNPNIRPKDECDGDTKVTATVDIDGVEVTITKIQKVKKKDKDGVTEVSLTNSFEVNAVSMGKKAFEEKMAEYGIDLSLFDVLSHVDSFTAQKQDKMRQVLMSMESSKSDYDFACEMADVADAKDILSNYTMEEARALQKNNKKKIDDVIGKDGDIIKGQIAENERKLSEIEVSDLELQKADLQHQIDDLKVKMNDTDKLLEEHQKIDAGVLELRFKLSDMERNANEKYLTDKRNADNELSDAQKKYDDAKSGIEDIKATIAKKSAMQTDLKIKIDQYAKQWKEVKEREFDENSTVCPYCNQELPEDKKSELVAEFENKKLQELSDIEELGAESRKSLEKLKDVINHLYKDLEGTEKTVEEYRVQCIKAKEKVDSFVATNIKDTDEYKAIEKEIAEKEKALEQENFDFAKMNELQDEVDKLNQQVALIDMQIESTQDAKDRIVELKKQKLDYEQQKADCDRILYQLDLIERKKNETLSSAINSHFSMVEWKLFSYLKNGSYKECCVPTYEGLDMQSQTNTALTVCMQVDICTSLQKFYGCELPIFLDRAESLDSVSKSKVAADQQIIFLNVSEDDELVIKG